MGFIGQLAACSLYLIFRYFVLICLNKVQLLFLKSHETHLQAGEKTSEMVNVINDSAVRVWPDTGTQQVDCLKNSRLKGKQHSLKKYSDANPPCEPPNHRGVCGFIFMESSMKLEAKDGSGQTEILRPANWMKYVAEGPHSGLCSAIIPWVPLQDGPEAGETYLEELKERFGGEDSKASSLVKGVRYHFEDDHRGKMLKPAFISSLQWLGRRGRTFDTTFEPRKKTPWQLSDAVELLKEVHKGVEDRDRVKIVISELATSGAK